MPEHLFSSCFLWFPTVNNFFKLVAPMLFAIDFANVTVESAGDKKRKSSRDKLAGNLYKFPANLIIC